MSKTVFKCMCGHWSGIHHDRSGICLQPGCKCRKPMVNGPVICNVDSGIGYHSTEIPKGELGEISKIDEEFLEFKDAVLQDAKVMQLCELADMLGAIEAFLEQHHPSFGLNDLVKMASLTRRAFVSGKRK